MSAEKGVVGNYHPVRHVTVVRQVRSRHQKTVAADPRLAPGSGATMNGHILPKPVMITDHHPALPYRIEREILGVGSEDRPVANGVADPHADMACDHGVGLNDTAVPDLGRPLDHGVRTDLDSVAEPGTRVNNSCGMNDGSHGRAIIGGTSEDASGGAAERPPESYDKESQGTVAAFLPWRG